MLGNGEQEIENNGGKDDILIRFRGKEIDLSVCLRSMEERS